jgi:two-component system OmpR family response regulator/two-component system response regulator RstA
MSDNSKRSILLIEDDEPLAALIQEYLQKHDFEVEVELRGDRAVERIIAERPDLVILDIMLPGKDGFEICLEVRPVYGGPLMMFTARDEDIDQLLGLELGADDYICKPVQPRLLLARIKTILRRVNGKNFLSPINEYYFDGFNINASSREVLLNGHLLDLTTAEFDLLWLLASHAGEVMSRDDILGQLRRIEYDGMDRSIDLRISRLRKKLGDNSASPQRIKTVRGSGYLFVGMLS